MPDFCPNIFGGYHLYFTSSCVVEAFHAHASVDRRQGSAAKFFIRSDGSVVVAKRGRLSSKTLRDIMDYIRNNHVQMYALWCTMSTNVYYNK